MYFRLMALSGLMVSHLCLAGPVYKVVGPDGKVSITDQKPAAAPEPKLAAKAKVVEVPRYPADAVASVYLRQLIVEAGMRFCSQYVPESASAILAGRDAWRARNSTVIDKASRVIGKVMPASERKILEVNGENEKQVYFSQLRAAPQPNKAAWCGKSPQGFAARELDVPLDLAQVQLILQYQLPED
jgi:hypothetical protein